MASIEHLVRELENKDDSARQRAIAELADSQDVAAVEPLLKALNDKVWFIQGSAAQALTKLYVQTPQVRALGAAHFTEPLAKLFKSKEAGLRKTVVAALGYMGTPEVVPTICQALQDKSESVRMAAAEALGRLGSAEAVPTLLMALEDKDEWVRMSAATSLGQLKAKEAVEPLIKSLQDSEANVREMAATALGELKDSRAGQPLITLLADESPEVRYKTIQALVKLGSSEAVPTLEKMAQSERDIAYDLPLKNVASQAARTLKKN